MEQPVSQKSNIRFPTVAVIGGGGGGSGVLLAGREHADRQHEHEKKGDEFCLFHEYASFL